VLTVSVLPLCTSLFVFLSCSNDQIATIVGLRVKGVGKRVAEKKMRLDLRESAIK
jgi:ATP-dependent Clp protease ATP-binding subunit ClpA